MLIFGSLNLNAQSCVKDISTNPVAPVNTELPVPFNLITVNPWLNTFNIGASTNGMLNNIHINPQAGWNLSGINLNANPYMFNPFTSNMPPEYSYLFGPKRVIDAQGNLTYSSAPQYMDWHWENGWEVMWLGTGYFPNGDPLQVQNNSSYAPGPSPLANNKVPYMALYNRYHRQLRVFANLFTNLGIIQDINLTLGYPNNTYVSGLFRGLGNYDQPLDRATQIRKASSHHTNANNAAVWFSSDFKMSYDPCICNYLQDPLEFNFRGINTMDVSLYGRTVEQKMDLMDANGKPTYADFLTNQGVSGFANGQGSVIYKNMDKMFTDYDKELDAYNTKLADYNSVENQIKRTLVTALKSGVVDGLTAGVGSLLTQTAVKAFVLKEAKNIGYKKLTADNYNTNVTDPLKNSAKSFLGKEYDKLSMQFFGDALNKPQPPSMPAANFSETIIKGTISQNNQVFISNFMVPGANPSQQGLTANGYPAYNKLMGHFALLKTPSIYASKLFRYDTKIDRALAIVTSTIAPPLIPFIQNGTYTIDSTYPFQITNSSELYIKLKEPLKWRLNHNIDINYTKSKVYVCFQIKVKTNNAGYNTERVDKTSYQLDNANNFELLHGKKLNGLDDELLMTTEWVPIEEVGQKLFLLKINNITSDNFETKSQMNISNFVSTQTAYDILLPRYQTDFNEFNLSLWHRSAFNLNDYYLRYNLSSIKMKIMTDLYFNQTTWDGEEINNVDVYTYQLFDNKSPKIENPEEFETIDYITSKGQWIASDEELTNSGILKYSTGLSTFNNITFDANSIGNTGVKESYDAATNTLHLFLQNVKLSGVIKSTGINVVIHATDDIEIDPTATVDPTISLEIKKDYFNFQPSVEATETEVSSFCNASTEYKANVSSFKTDPINPLVEINHNSIQNFKIVPNPATESINLVFNTLDETQGSLFVYDITGHLIKTVFNNRPLIKGDHNIGTDISDLAAGEYIVRLITTEGVQTAKLVKIGQ